MPADQGSLDLLNHPIAQELLHAPIPARFAYTCPDGTPRVVPIWFHWNGSEVVLAGPPAAPKFSMLKEGGDAALTIDTNDWPYKVLLIRGKVHMDTVDGVPTEYAAAAEKHFGPEGGKAWVAQVEQMASKNSRVFIKPTWVGILDFQERWPSAIEKAMAAAAGAQD